MCVWGKPAHLSPSSAAGSCVSLNRLLHISEPQVPLAQVRTRTISGLRSCPEGLKQYLVWAQPFYQVGGGPTSELVWDWGPVSSGVAQQKPQNMLTRAMMGPLTPAEADCWIPCQLVASGAPEVDGGELWAERDP